MARTGAVSNADIAALLTRIADLLEAKEENPFRIKSYRNAAITVAGVRQSLANIVSEKGAEGLTGLKGVGEKLAALIQEYVEKGKVEILADLEKGVPEEKLKAVREEKKPGHSFETPIDVPANLILEIDEEYRRRASAGKLKMIAPRLLNPEKKAWLPIMSREHRGFAFTAMFSNTPTAHKLGKTGDWVVVYAKKGKAENQWTVVTESRGRLKGKRVIRGREKESAEAYQE
jgi:DNA polymerase (family X)